jgi:UDP-2-acetamido-2-deoxy-ribo-hexuluronate aminotransferase
MIIKRFKMHWRNVILAVNTQKQADIQLVFDTNILVDALTARGQYFAYAVDLLEMVRNGKVEGWYAHHTLTTVYYLLERAFAAETQNRKTATDLAQTLVRELLQFLKPLPQVGDELLHIQSMPGDDLEDLLIFHLASSYLPNPLVVTRDKWFLQHASLAAAHPKEIIERGLTAWESRDQPIPFTDLATQQHCIRPQLERNIHRVLHHGQYIMGPEVAELEGKLARYTGAQHCITVASGTEALLIALMALDVKPGDEIITTPFTFVATAEVIALLGATPVFVDIEPDTCNIDASKIEVAITPRTRAIMPVSLYGQPADMDEINAIAARHGLTVIEDAAQSFGAEYKGHKSCNLSTIGCTSFFPSKPLGCYGDGGAIFTSDDKLAKAMREIRVHGQERRYVHTRIGVGGRMDTLQCAVVLGKLERFEWEVEQRLRIGARYNELFAGKVPTVTQRPDRTSVFAQYTVFVDNREQVQEKLKTAGVPTAVHYPIPLNRQSAYQALSRISNNVSSSDAMAGRVMSLPMSADLSQHEQDQIFMLVIEALGK